MGDFNESAVGLFKASDFICGAVPVFSGSQESKAGGSIAIESQDRIDQVFQRSRTRYRVFSRGLPHRKDRHTGGLCNASESLGDLNNLGDTSGAAVNVARSDGLHRVDNNHVWRVLGDVTEKDL